MGFVSPMLASPMKAGFEPQSGEWSAEEKLDGHRLICEVSDNPTPHLFVKKGITAWSRYGIERVLPTHILEPLSKLPNGIYDGELIVPGKRSYGVTELTNSSELVYVLFDLIQFEDEDYTEIDYNTRHFCLCVHTNLKEDEGALRVISSVPVSSMDDVYALRDKIWERDGEGLILKRRNAPYRIGKRSKDLIKVKALRSAVLTVIGWVESRGQKNYRGQYGICLLQDDEGCRVTVTTKNNEMLRRCEEEAERTGQKPFIGRKLVVEFQERTPDGSYRHPRWDRWEDE